MTKNSIGQFIAALRKVNGMTQQEVADRLNVSNKAVSRWERDECAPDLSLIPAIAEMFGVSCDELLRGERIDAECSGDKMNTKTVKQLKNLVRRALSSFKSLIMVSVSVGLAGLVSMFGIAYGFYRPVIGFAVMLNLETAASVIAAFAVSRAKCIKNDNELFDRAPEDLCAEFDRTLANWSFAAFFAAAAAVILSLGQVLLKSDYINSVVTFRSYITGYVLPASVLLAIVWLKGKPFYSKHIFDVETPENEHSALSRMTAIQMGLLLLMSALILLSPYWQKRGGGFTLFDLAVLLAIVCYPLSILCVVVFASKNKEHRPAVIFCGSRNFLMKLPMLILGRAHYVSWIHVGHQAIDGSGEVYIRYQPTHYWDVRYIFIAFGLSVLIYLLFYVTAALYKKYQQG